jgi:trimethylamine-N-oxide reductase (cytochrome c)
MGLATAVSTSSVANATALFSPIEKIPHACHVGAFYAHVQDGKIIDISAQESDEHPTHLITSVIDRTYSQSRINYPYVRKSYLEGSDANK